MTLELPPIAKTAERLMLEIEQAVRRFPRYHKYALGNELRASARQIMSLVNRAWRDRAQQGKWIKDLSWQIDELHVHLQVGKQLQAFASFRQFNLLAGIAYELGRQCGGWLKQQHLKSQNPTGQGSAQVERAQILSSQDAAKPAMAEAHQ